MRRTTLGLGLLLACAACADILGVHEYTYAPGDGSTPDAAMDATSSLPDGSEAATDGGSNEAAPDAGCTLCTSTASPACALSCNETAPKYLAVDSTRLFWSNVGGTTTFRSLVRPSGAPSAFATASSGPNAAAASTAQYYFTDGTGLRVAALDGGVRTLMASANANSVAQAPPQASSFIFFAGASANIYKCVLPDCTSPLLQIDMRSDPQGLVAIWDGLNPYGYWVEMGSAGHPLNGGALTGGFMVTQYGNLNPMTTNVIAAEDKTHVWYTTYNGTSTNVYLAGDFNPKFQTPGIVRSMAAGGGMLWIAIDDMGTNGRVVKFDGNNPSFVAQNQDRPSSIILDAMYVYWTTLGGTVMRAGRN